MRIALAVLCICPALAGEPKAKPGDYPAHAQLQKFALGADFLVHSFSDGRSTFVTEDYLVIEVAVYPARGESIPLSTSHFTLRINGKKAVLYAQTPGMVAASLKYPDWEQRGRLEAGAGMGNAGVILGRPQPVGRFPGDPSDRRRLPQPPKAPEAENPSGAEKEPPARADEVAVSAALQEGETRGPIAGYIYFPYKGKIKNLKTLELIYNSAAGNAELRLLN